MNFSKFLIFLFLFVFKAQAYSTDQVKVSEHEKLARQGDSRAQFKVALMYYSGEGLIQDHRKAFFWFKKAAEQGVTEAQFNVAFMYASH